MKSCFLLKIYLLFLISFSSLASEIKFTKISSGHKVIWAMQYHEGKIYFTQRKGKINILDLKTKKTIEIKGAPSVYSKGQGGLLDLKLHPNFKENSRIYLSYSKKINDKEKTTAVGYGFLKNDTLEGFKDIFIAKGSADTSHHFGSRMTFDNEGYLYISVGDRGNRDNPQNLKVNFGKIMRIKDDGSVPQDNPFTNKPEALSDIWSYGHRNPQGLFYDLKENILYEMEHGPRGGDEINILAKGENYGWPLASYGKEYTSPFSVGKEKIKGTIQPLKFFTPSIAPCDLVLYSHSKFPSLKGALLSGALALTHLNAFNPVTKKEIRLFEKEKFRVRSITLSNEGDIYFATDNGSIYKLI